jgi:hypothetical protein
MIVTQKGVRPLFLFLQGCDDYEYAGAGFRSHTIFCSLLGD